jgi:hypothetical protein
LGLPPEIVAYIEQRRHDRPEWRAADLLTELQSGFGLTIHRRSPERVSRGKKSAAGENDLYCRQDVADGGNMRCRNRPSRWVADGADPYDRSGFSMSGARGVARGVFQTLVAVIGRSTASEAGRACRSLGAREVPGAGSGNVTSWAVPLSADKASYSTLRRSTDCASGAGVRLRLRLRKASAARSRISKTL